MGTIFVDNLEPQSGTSLTLGASGDTISLASGATQSGFGKVAQVVSAVDTTEYSNTSSTYSDITGLTLNITPSATSSKVLIMMQMTNRVHNASANTSRGTVKLLRDSTDLQTMEYFAQLSIGGANPDSLIHSGSHIYMDSPSSTSQITYKYQGKTGAQTFRAYVKNMVAMEILA